MENNNLEQVFVLNEAQARARYNLCKKKLIEVARAAGALSRAGGRKNLYLKEKMDAYFTASAESLK